MLPHKAINNQPVEGVATNLLSHILECDYLWVIVEICDNITILSNDFYSCQYSHLNTLYRSFIRKQATLEDLQELEKLIEVRKKAFI
ncbi:hypothetical protein [Enterococcus faecium]|uniref:hypothetical protein n=1 Tax=Enterococcus faecium TaxID=1352 RepID=UPI0012AED1E9|nr:hypothetical protein [Enterococcus faecium]HBK4580139.1 hypothetical protein [Enterococcus faecium]